MSAGTSQYRIDGPSPSVSAEALEEIGRRTFIEAFGHLYSASDLEKFLTEKHSAVAYSAVLNDPASAVWVAYGDAGDLVGYLTAGPCALPVDNMPANAGELIRFYITKQSRGAGLGGRMLERALSWLHEHFDHVYLSVYSENIKAQRLYERHGFEKIQKYFFMVGEHADPEFIMKRMTPVD